MWNAEIDVCHYHTLSVTDAVIYPLLLIMDVTVQLSSFNLHGWQ